MKATMNEKRLYGSNVAIIKRTDCCNIYRVKDYTGEAILTSYNVFPGIELIYNDVHMQYICLDAMPPGHIIEINHCREGRIEFETISGKYLYISKGDLSINKKDGLKNTSFFPLSHYHGVTISIDMDITKDYLADILHGVEINLPKIKQKLCDEQEILIMKEQENFEHIFAELYSVPEKIRLGYYKIKVLEILLFLSSIDVTDFYMSRRYYSKQQIEKIKVIESYLTNHLDEKITVQEVSELFDVPLSSLKSIFKEVYGTSIYAYIRNYRMQYAVQLLKNTDKDISEVAGMVGYENASKFASAFKTVMKRNPNEYRKMSRWSILNEME